MEVLLTSKDIRDFKIQRRRRQQERQKKQLVWLAKQQLRTCITHFCTFLSRFCTTTMWKCLISRFMEDVNNQRQILFLFLSLNLVPWNSASEGFAYNWQSKWVGIIAIKTERSQIHFLSDVVVAVASLDLKVPIREFTQRRRRPQRERHKSNRFTQGKQQLCTCITLFCTFLCRRCTTATWNCLFSRFLEDGTKDNNFLFLFLNFDAVL